MRIGVNALYLIPGGVGGTEIYLRRTLAAMAEIDSVNRYFIFTNRDTGPDLIPESPNFVRVPQPVRATVRPARIAWEQTGLPLALLRERIDVLWNPGFTAPVFCPCPQVTVFHDLQHKRHPEYFRWFDLPFWRALLFASAHLSRVVLADSHATAADLRYYYRLPERSIRTVHLGVDRLFLELGRRRAPADPPFFLCLSTLHPHKNIDRLLEAFALFRRARPGFRLVVPGLFGFYTDRLLALRKKLGLEDAVEFTGWIERERVYELYRTAFAFVYPSRFEGFGLPVLEALAAAVPTACADIPALREVAADAALTFHPDDRQGLFDCLLRLADDADLRAQLSRAGPLRAARFTWEQTARATLEALEEAV